MIQFADEATITVHSGKGGNGCISFRREKYIPNGGPNGGDGGRGGSVIFCVRRNLRTLAHLRYHPVFKAKNGGDGQGWNRYGKDGEDVIIPVPPGTTIRDAVTGELIHDFTTESEDEQFLFLEGGKGGWGNVHFKSSTNQAPRYAHPGKPGEERELRVELSIMADIGLVGFPNAGKSSLLDLFTNARPKIAPYPFTTKVPNLGVLHVDQETDLIIADIPGIIEGASDGAGLGIRFLKHISRTAGLLFMIDCSDDNYMTAYDSLLHELEQFGAGLMEKPRIILCNKIDVEGACERADELIACLKKKDPAITVIPVSVMARTNITAVRNAIVELVEKMERTRHPGKNHAQSSDASEKSRFMAERSVDTSMEEQFPGSE
ncbi:MAG TPA: GTPase ObgE [Treponema sp.]|jgi:GTP-binding protein|nr:GTPase ObgE [Treponema sp.]HBB42650.1 GTPase ObgE [Treponema sp.]HCA20298.1 GTPase ObgE [Treponema sp.]